MTKLIKLKIYGPKSQLTKLQMLKKKQKKKHVYSELGVHLSVGTSEASPT